MDLDVFFKKLKFSIAIKNVFKISFGTILGQVISMITLPIFARIYGTEIIGIWTLFNSISTIINSFSDLGLTNAIMVGKDEKETLRLYKVISTILMLISIIASIIISGYYLIFPNNFKINIIFFMIYIFLSIFTLQQIQICYTWLNKKGKYDILMKNPFINNVIFGIIGIALGLLGFKEYGYYIGWIIGQLITLIHMKKFLPKSIISFNPSDYKEVFFSNIHFIRYQLPANVISNFKNQLPILLIKAFFGTKMLGYYSISVKLLNVPISLLAKSMGRIYFKTISDMNNRGESIGEFTFRNLSNAMKASIIPIVLFISSGDIIINILFGSGNEIAGIMTRIVALQYIFMFLSMTVHGLPIVLNKQKYVMAICIVQIIVFIISFVFGRYLFNNIYIALMLMSLLFSLINIVYFSMLFRVMNIKWNRYVKNVTCNLIVIIILALVVRSILILTNVVSTI